MEQLKRKALAKKMKSKQRQFKSLDKCFLDISINDKTLGRLEIELWNTIVPKTSQNFYQLCEQETYKNCPFHRIIPDFMCQGGDFTNGDGTGGKSIYGDKFEDENFELKHTGRGILSMANSGPNTNGSQFFICFKETEWLDEKHVVFGKISKGLELLDKIEEFGQNSGEPTAKIIITDCGVIKK